MEENYNDREHDDRMYGYGVPDRYDEGQPGNGQYYNEQPYSGKKKKKSGGGRFAAGFVTGSFFSLLVCALVIGAAVVFSGRMDLFGNIGSQGSSSSQSQSSAEGQTEGAQDNSQQASDILSPGNAALAQKFQQKTAEISSIIDQTFIFPVDEDKVLDGALKGYVSGLDDVYSVYYTAQEYQDTLKDSDGNYVGIGVVVQQEEETNAVKVLNVYPDSPAEAGGMQKNDIIIKVEGEDISAWELTDVVNAIRGEAGTQVNITVYREGQELDISMIRKALDKITVESEMLENNVGYIKFTEFDAVSVDQMRNAINDLSAKGMQKLVLDLRDNPGGLLTTVVSVADDLLPKADILYIDDKAGNRTTYDSQQSMLFNGPIVLLINGNSASASEVLSGALKDNDRALIVGEQSFGKGIVQTFYQLSDGSGVKLTTAHYFTPAGVDIHGVGITPDLEVKDDPDTEEDEQLVRAVEEAEKMN